MAKFKYQDAAIVTVGKLLDERRDEILRDMAWFEKERDALIKEKSDHIYKTWKLE